MLFINYLFIFVNFQWYHYETYVNLPHHRSHNIKKDYYFYQVIALRTRDISRIKLIYYFTAILSKTTHLTFFLMSYRWQYIG